MINRACAKRAFDVTLLVILILTFSLGPTVIKTRAKLRGQPLPNSSAINSRGTPRGTSKGTPTEQESRRNIGVLFDKLRAGAPVTIAYLGGSVMAGAGASNPEKTSSRSLVTEWFRKSYPKS